jgi:chemotaxis protein MotB
MRADFSSRAYALFIVSMATLFLLTGCVTKSSYDEVLQQRNRLVRRNQELASVAVSLDRAVRLRDNEIAALETEQQELADEVTRWAVRGAIEMQLLADGLHLILPYDVLFESGGTELSVEGRKLIVELVQEINEQPYQVAVLGFTDNVPVGPALVDRYPSNWELSGARAAGVVRVMESEGIPAEQLIAVSRGETGGIATNDTPEGRAQNRRIDIRIRPVVNSSS